MRYRHFLVTELELKQEFELLKGAEIPRGLYVSIMISSLIVCKSRKLAPYYFRLKKKQEF